MPRLVLDQREHQQLGAALLQFAGGKSSKHMS
jgi:hypothetical protein